MFAKCSKIDIFKKKQFAGLVRELNPGLLSPEARTNKPLWLQGMRHEIANLQNLFFSIFLHMVLEILVQNYHIYSKQLLTCCYSSNDFRLTQVI